MYNEFYGDPSGMDVLKSYEIDDTDVGRDMAVLFCYSLVSFEVTLFDRNSKSKKLRYGSKWCSWILPCVYVERSFIWSAFQRFFL